ncbi:hypothetical protein CKO12_01495 [Chromatium okenii]|uniref:hypothetical protein n=1 Tax=Chromatium okenii TaxID=61644 RepID=UPI0019072AD9|nr:hypothetical protein [Chromatium okenii]MBK1640573.1 hypothetical protein [Chromatium okenii]
MNDQLELKNRIKTYEATKKPDAATVAGAAGSTALGATLGGVAAPSIAGWFGANVISTSGLGTVLSWLPAGMLKTIGIPTVATITTPVGWVLGSIAICAGLGYGVYRLAHSGGKNDEKRSVLGKGILNKIQALFQAKAQPVATQQPASLADQTAQVEALFRELGREGVIAADKVDSFVNQLKSGKLSLDDAIAVLRDCGKELSHSTLNPAAPNSETALQQAASARALTVMHKGVLNHPDQPNESFLIQMQQRFGIDRERAVELYRDAPLDSNPTATARQLADLFTQEIMRGALTALEETAQDMQQGQAAFVRFLEIQQTLQQQFNTQIAAIDRAGEDALAAINRI